ncbi:hypothetical protein PACTADRAFT_34138 [Pachysolen tannophilus NRRL Y-2460]|uniref:Uncharacterized protein n=1 Tax=Pachysolen tannophilus NRRL Y-2460 TaxID=669874 RepID=A0A1E4TUX5_PACTA|nr:hypothetical protein PACTADRAFT_34138 [Pachysolen tannophilus NRRL Y-2460]
MSSFVRYLNSHLGVKVFVYLGAASLPIYWASRNISPNYGKLIDFKLREEAVHNAEEKVQTSEGFRQRLLRNFQGDNAKVIGRDELEKAKTSAKDSEPKPAESAEPAEAKSAEEKPAEDKSFAAESKQETPAKEAEDSAEAPAEKATESKESAVQPTKEDSTQQVSEKSSEQGDSSSAADTEKETAPSQRGEIDADKDGAPIPKYNEEADAHVGSSGSERTNVVKGSSEDEYDTDSTKVVKEPVKANS